MRFKEKERRGFEGTIGNKRYYGDGESRCLCVCVREIVDLATGKRFRDHVWLPAKRFEGLEEGERVRFSGIPCYYHNKGRRKKSIVRVKNARTAPAEAAVA